MTPEHFLLQRLMQRLTSLLALVSPPDIHSFVRASGDIVCEHCGFDYFRHAPHPLARFLVMTCDGRLLKL